jgi:hypothetical protein
MDLWSLSRRAYIPADLARIFLSYRRHETPDGDAASGRFADRLRERFGKTGVYRDKESNAGSPDWRAKIEREIRSCRVMLAWIDRRWVDSVDRLHDDTDVLRGELALALRLGKTVVPVLVARAKLPKTSELPAELGALTAPQAIDVLELDGPAFDDGVRRVAEQIRSGNGWAIGAAVGVVALLAVVLIRPLVGSAGAPEAGVAARLDAGQATSDARVSPLPTVGIGASSAPPLDVPRGIERRHPIGHAPIPPPQENATSPPKKIDAQEELDDATRQLAAERALEKQECAVELENDMDRRVKCFARHEPVIEELEDRVGKLRIQVTLSQ